MPELNYLPELELQVRMAMDVPEPNVQTMDALREQFITRGAATLKPDSRLASASRPFQPEKEPKMKRITPRFSPQITWGLAIFVLVVLLTVLFTSPTVANALRRLLGYIPGVGVVETTPSILVLADPVIIERDDVILTIEQAIATLTKTVVVYRHVEHPADGTYLPPATDFVEDRPVLRLPDGSKLDVTLGRHQPQNGSGFLYALEFPPLPTGVTEVTLELTRLAGLPPGAGPENWEIPIRFKVGDPSQIALPVVEYEPPLTATPRPLMTAQPGAGTQVPLYGISITLDRAVDLDDGYILMGSLQWTDATIEPDAMTLGTPVIKDASDQVIEFEFTNPDMYPGTNELRQYWAYKITTKNFVPPLSLNFHILIRETAEARFQFDPGQNLQDGQTWDLNIDVPVKGHIVKVISAQYSEYPSNKVFEFTMTSDKNVTYAEVISLLRPFSGGGGGGSGAPQTNTTFKSGFSIEGEVPEDGLTLAIVGLDVLVPGEWGIIWNPPTSMQQNTPVPATAQLLPACLTRERWHQALQNKEPLPVDLKGKLTLSMDDLS